MDEKTKNTKLSHEKQKKPKDERKENRGGGRHGKRTKISENEVQSDYDENKLYGK